MCMSPVTEECLEKYGKRLIGRTDIEDALKRLDKLTHEEARMGIAENLRATHAVDERVRGVTEQVLAVDDRVVNVNDRVAEVIHGVKIIFSPEKRLTKLFRWKGSKASYGTNGQRCRSSETFVVVIT
jgi:hypothetical protein